MGDRRDGGSAPVEAVIIVPVVVLLTLLIVQVAMLWFGRHVVQAAAQTGVNAATGFSSDADAGRSAAAQYLEQVAPNLLDSPVISVDAQSGIVQVTVSAHVTSIVPFVDFTVQDSASAPPQHFVTGR